jgi:hypothetical protein
MMRYRLRTLLIVLCIAPPMLGWGWREDIAYRHREAWQLYLDAARERARSTTVPAMRLVVVPTSAFAYADVPPGWTHPLQEVVAHDNSE